MTLQLREGGYYKTRDGRKVGPLKYGRWHTRKWFEGHIEGEDRVFRLNGVHDFGDRDLDLIAEWTEGPVRTVTRREVVDGRYGVLHIKQFDNTCFLLSLDGETWVRMDRTGSSAAAAALLELAGALGSE